MRNLVAISECHRGVASEDIGKMLPKNDIRRSRSWDRMWWRVRTLGTAIWHGNVGDEAVSGQIGSEEMRDGLH